MIRIQELINHTLLPTMQRDLILACMAVGQGTRVTVYLTVPKMTDSKPRIGGQDYVDLGFPRDAQIGPLELHRYVDNKPNQKLDRVGEVYLKVRSITRADGLRPFGWTAIRPSDITSFRILGIESPEPEPEPEMATKALAEAAKQTAI